MVQWLRLHTSTVGDIGLIPGGGTKNPTFYVAEGKKKLSITLSQVHSLGEPVGQ